MVGIKSLVGGLVIDKILSARPAAASKNKSYHIMVAFAGLFVVIAFVFALIALYHSLLEQYAPDIAALYTAGASLAIALITVLAAHSVREYHKPKIQRSVHDMKTQFDAMLKDLEGDWEKPVRENPKTAVALAALAGYILADRIN